MLGISGGQDSSLAGRLCRLAVEELVAEGDAARFIAVRLPYDVQHDEADAQVALDFIQPQETVVFNVKGGVDGLAEEYARRHRRAPQRLRQGQRQGPHADGRAVRDGRARAGCSSSAPTTRPRPSRASSRSTATAEPTSCRSRASPSGRVARCCSTSERPSACYLKVPTADLLDENPGQADEANLGLKYHDIDAYLEGEEIDPEIADRIEARFLQTRHKRAVPVSMFDDWWI